MTRDKALPEPGTPRPRADDAGDRFPGGFDVGSALDAVEAALGGEPMRDADPADRAAACRAAAKVAIRRALRGEDTRTSLDVERLQSLISALDDLSDRIARDGDDPGEAPQPPGGMP